MYIKPPHDYPYSLDRLASDFYNTSFPKHPSDAVLALYGVFPVAPTARPSSVSATQMVEEIAPAQIDGVWTQQWSVRELTPEELKARVPTVVTMRQARLALLQAGLLSQVGAAIAAIEDPVQRQAVQIEWEYATEVDVTHPWVQALTTALGLSEAQLDALFTLAATL